MIYQIGDRVRLVEILPGAEHIPIGVVGTMLEVHTSTGLYGVIFDNGYNGPYLLLDTEFRLLSPLEMLAEAL